MEEFVPWLVYAVLVAVTHIAGPHTIVYKIAAGLLQGKRWEPGVSPGGGSDSLGFADSVALAIALVVIVFLMVGLAFFAGQNGFAWPKAS